MTEKIKAIGRSSVVPIQLGLLLTLCAGVWVIATKTMDWDNRLQAIERRTAYRWTWQMERRSWKEFSLQNPGTRVPDVDQIRDDFQPH